MSRCYRIGDPRRYWLGEGWADARPVYAPKDVTFSCPFLRVHTDRRFQGGRWTFHGPSFSTTFGLFPLNDLLGTGWRMRRLLDVLPVAIVRYRVRSCVLLDLRGLWLRFRGRPSYEAYTPGCFFTQVRATVRR